MLFLMMMVVVVVCCFFCQFILISVVNISPHGAAYGLTLSPPPYPLSITKNSLKEDSGQVRQRKKDFLISPPLHAQINYADGAMAQFIFAQFRFSCFCLSLLFSFSERLPRNKAGYTAQDAPSMRSFHLRK